MIIRNDNRESYPVPQDVKDHIRRVGGVNIYGEPNYRLLLAEDRIVKAAGAWNIWDENLSLDDRGGLGIAKAQEMLQSGCREEEISEFFDGQIAAHPLRVVNGMMETQLYTWEGWILENWKPTKGSRENWESVTFRGEPTAGPYPAEGDYGLFAGPSPYRPSCQEITDSIRRGERQMQDKPRDARQRVLLLLERRRLLAKKKEEAFKDKLIVVAADVSRISKTLSLTAGLVRQQLADAAGLKGHYGN